MANNQLVTKCRACNKDIMFIATDLYKKTPVDADPVWVRPDAKGPGTYILPNGGTIRGEAVGDAFDDENAGLRLAYVSHFATCTNPEAFRKPRKQRDRTKGMKAE